jgi:hypothetical protein
MDNQNRQSIHNITIQNNTRGSILNMMNQGNQNQFNEIDNLNSNKIRAR